MSVKVGVVPGAWEWKGGPAAFFHFVDACEVFGWDSLWLSDRLVSERLSLEPVTALAAAAARTQSMKFGTSVLALSVRNPAVLAKELATVDFLSGGRLLPAVGLGGEDEREYEATGTLKKERAGRTDEAIPLLRRLWTEDHVTHHGRFYHLTDVTIAPKPKFAPYPPIWIGGRSKHAWDRVARLGDGWLVSSVTAPEVEEGVRVIKSGLAENDRRIEEDHYGVLLGVYLAATHQWAKERAVSIAARPRPDVPLEAYTALGPPETILARLKEYVAAGASKFVLRLACPEEEGIEQLRLLAEYVVKPVNAGEVALT